MRINELTPINQLLIFNKILLFTYWQVVKRYFDLSYVFLQSTIDLFLPYKCYLLQFTFKIWIWSSEIFLKCVCVLENKAVIWVFFFCFCFLVFWVWQEKSLIINWKKIVTLKQLLFIDAWCQLEGMDKSSDCQCKRLGKHSNTCQSRCWWLWNKVSDKWRNLWRRSIKVLVVIEQSL